MIKAAKRLAIEEGGMDDWWCSHSPRNGNSNAEGLWCHWVHLARMILADEKTRQQMPEHYREYAAPHVYDEHHPDCKAER